MNNEDSVKFSEWWIKEGSKIEGKFALAVSAWETAKKKTSAFEFDNIQPKIDKEPKTILRTTVVDGTEYFAVEEDIWGTCRGCVGEHNARVCGKLATDCAKSRIIWVKEI